MSQRRNEKLPSLPEEERKKVNKANDRVKKAVATIMRMPLRCKYHEDAKPEAVEVTFGISEEFGSPTLTVNIFDIFDRD